MWLLDATFLLGHSRCRGSFNALKTFTANLEKTDTVIAIAAAHHRLVWIHPFLDGNGRVARLISHASLLESLGTGAVWSIAPGLARNAEAYMGHLAACDSPRRNDLAGRGQLSEENLPQFTRFSLTTCLDQVTLSCGQQRRSRMATCPGNQVRFSRQYSIGESFNALRSLPL